MPKLRCYAPPMRDAFLPAHWIDGAAPNGSTQAEMLIWAASKDDVVLMLQQRGLAPHWAASIAKACRWIKDGTHGSTWQMLIDEHAIDPTRPAVWAARTLVRDSKIMEVLPDGTARLAAVLGYDSHYSGRGMYVAEVHRPAVLRTVSGRVRVLPENLTDYAHVAGLDEQGRIVMDWFDARTAEPTEIAGHTVSPHMFGLTLCCNASDKGMEDGVGCRGCYGLEGEEVDGHIADAGNYLFRTSDGQFPGLDPVAELFVPTVRA